MKNYSKKLILASKSPRRQELIKTLGRPYEIIPSNYEEDLKDKKFSYVLIENVSKNKALEVLHSLKNKQDAIIVGADTVVVLGEEILLKPADEKEAYEELKKLSGKTHKVVTGITVIDVKTEKSVTATTTSEVSFQNLTDEQIWNYIKTKHPLDKAGAYGIQELDEKFVKSLKGSKNNVIGLCPKALENSLTKLDKILSLD